MIIDVEIVVGGQEYRVTAPEPAVLHGVVQDDDVQPFYLSQQLLHASHTALAHRDRHFRKVTVELHRLVAEGVRRR